MQCPHRTERGHCDLETKQFFNQTSRKNTASLREPGVILLHIANDAFNHAESLNDSLCGLLAPALAAARIGSWKLDVHTGLATWDRTTSQILGAGDQEQLTPKRLPIHPDDQADVARRLLRNVYGDGEQHVDVRIIRPDGSHRWVRSTARAPLGRELEGRWVVGIVRDITEEKLTNQALRATEKKLLSVLEGTQDCIYSLDHELRFRYINARGKAHLGRSEDVLGAKILDLIPGGDQTELGQCLFRVLSTGQAEWIESYFPPSRRWYEANVTPADGGLTVFFRDTTFRRATEERIRWTADHDALTGLPNRHLFQNRLDELVQKGNAFALLLLDVNDFKRVNDTLGHDAGDALLRAFAVRLAKSVRENDLVARLGGDEFALILDGISSENGVSSAAGRVFEELSNPCVHAGHFLECCASIGAALFPLHGRSRETLLKQADMALYAAKSAGSQRAELFRPELRHEMQLRTSKLNLARTALRQKTILPHYQPKVELRSGRLSGFEALLRWRHDKRGFQLPDTIAPAFEDLDLAAQISDRMIEAAVSDMRRWLDDNVSFGHVAINASAAEFRRGNFAETLLEQLHRHEVPPHCLQLEVTETVFLGRGAEYVEKALKTLSDAGVSIALDDFGTGYASLAHLKNFPVDIIKLDRSFVSNLLITPDDAAIVKAVINLGRSLNIQVVAEGIETPEQHRELRRIGSKYGQGFLYQKAIPAEAVPAIVKQFAKPRDWGEMQNG